MSDFIKKRWLILAMLIVVLAAVPTLIWYSGKLKTELRDRISKEVQQDLSTISSAGGKTLQLNYQVPAIAGKPAVEFRGPPNEIIINKFKDARNKQQDDLKKIIDDALTFNQNKRTVLLEGIFPEPAATDQAIKPLEFRRVYFDRAHQDLLRRLRAGGPLDPVAFGQELRDKMIELIRNETGQENADLATLAADVQAKINAGLVKFRLSRYRERAATLSFYCEMDALHLPVLPNDATAPSIPDAWRWQWDYWVREDILTAAAAANAPTADQGVPGAVIKRIDSITIDPVLSGGQPDPGTPNTAVYPPGSDAVVPSNPTTSVTGRPYGPGSSNSFFDVRKVTVELVAQASRLPAFIDALSATNFMSILDCDLFAVEADDELKNGYFYGSEPVVRARIQIESIWLREWMVPLTPPSVRLELGMPDPPAPPAAEPGKQG